MPSQVSLPAPLLQCTQVPTGESRVHEKQKLIVWNRKTSRTLQTALSLSFSIFSQRFTTK